MKETLFLMLLALGLALLAGPGTARADGDISFGIRPTKAFESRPGTFSYFSYELTPGAVLSDAALVMNTGEAPVTLKLHAADGITAVNGGIAFAKEGQESSGVSRGVNRWVSLAVTEIALEPGEEMAVPFTINVPPDASTGQHVAGLVVEAPPSEASPSEEGGGQFLVRVVQQSGVAVVIDVLGPNVAGLTGPHVARLEITGACLKEQGDIGATFEIGVYNTGNIFLKGEGSLLITDRNGDELASSPLKMETVLPGDATTFQVTQPLHLADGDYLVSADLKYADLEFAEKTAVLEAVEIKVKDGQPKVGCEGPEESDGPLPPPDITEISAPPAEEGGPGIGRYAAYGGPLLAVTLAALALLLLRRRRGARTSA